MTPTRAPDLQRVLDLTEHAILARTAPGQPAHAAAGKIFGAIKVIADEMQTSAARLPACASFDRAVAGGLGGPDDIASLTRAFAALEPRVTWRNRAGASPEFAAGQANAMLVGPGGLEPRDDVWIGASLLAAHITYPDHHHPPEEIYIVLSPGEWRQKQDPWHEPGVGGVVYNPPDIMHAMRSHDAPLLAIWCLWADGAPRTRPA